MNSSFGISFLAPAKLNISLKVFGKRPDGLHEIRSVMVPVSLYDEVNVEEADSGIFVESTDPSVPTDGSNSCHKAAAAFIGRFGAPGGVRIRIGKKIPSEAGLGGGSSDAAAAIKGLSAIAGGDISCEGLRDVAASVGADVPFFLLGGPALAEGFGDVLTPVEWEVPFFAVIAKPSFGVSTREGYARLGRSEGPAPRRETAPSFRSWGDVKAAVGNDFEGVLGDRGPGVARIKEELMCAGAEVSGLTGSGSAVFGLFRTEEGARQAFGMMESGNGRTVFIARNI